MCMGSKQAPAPAPPPIEKAPPKLMDKRRYEKKEPTKKPKAKGMNTGSDAVQTTAKSSGLSIPTNY